MPRNTETEIAQPELNLASDLVRFSFREFQAGRIEAAAKAAVFLGSNQGTRWFEFLGIDQGRALRRIGYASRAQEILDQGGADVLDDEAVQVVKRTIEHVAQYEGDGYEQACDCDLATSSGPRTVLVDGKWEYAQRVCDNCDTPWHYTGRR